MVTLNTIYKNKYTGLSTDDKPIDIKNGDEFFEIDTSKTYIFDEQSKEWIEIIGAGGSGGGGGVRVLDVSLLPTTVTIDNVEYDLMDADVYVKTNNNIVEIADIYDSYTINLYDDIDVNQIYLFRSDEYDGDLHYYSGTVETYFENVITENIPVDQYVLVPNTAICITNSNNIIVIKDSDGGSHLFIPTSATFAVGTSGV